ncbi:MAG TPA: DMT family transporter [Thermoanaerobaculia bacterium]|jgi:drug/metabolite transporter (DMT)-like permease|nr:DMT family transporter [Thermoanaerobaculia bacterium]
MNEPAEPDVRLCPESSAAAPPAPGPAPVWRVHLTLILVQAAFGGFHVVAKAVLADLAPLALAAIRVGLATPILMALAWRRDRFIPARRDLPMLALLGGLGVFANQALFITGLKFTTATNASILMTSIPVFAIAAAAVMGVERITLNRLAGIILSVVGALVLVNPFRFSTGHAAALGNSLILVNGLCYALFLVLQRPILTRVPWRTVIAASFFFGAVGILPIAIPALAALDPSKVGTGAWLGVAYIIIFPTVFAYAASTWAVRRSSPALVAAYSTLQPLVASALAAAFLGEQFGWEEGIGFALIAAGLWLVSGRAQKLQLQETPRRRR